MRFSRDGEPLYWKLDDDKHPQPCSQKEWAEAFADFDKRQLAETFTANCRISTVFLGLDHGFGSGPPVLFETMVFEQEKHVLNLEGHKFAVHEDLGCWRYTSYADAMAGHAAAVERTEAFEAKAAAMLNRSKAENPE